MGPVATTTFRGLGAQAYLDQLHAIDADGCADPTTAAATDPAALDRCVTRVVQLAEAVLEEREQLLRWGHEQSHPSNGVFAKVGPEFLEQMQERAAAYSEAYLAIDHTLATWRSWMHARARSQSPSDQQTG
jgi:hypothetical protein